MNEMKVLVINVHLSLLEARRIKEVVSVGHAQGHTFVNDIAFAFHRDDRVVEVEGWVPARNRSIFINEDEQSGLRVSVLRHFEEWGAVEYGTRRIPWLVIVFSWNRHHEGVRGSVLPVERGDSGPVVADPDDAVGRR